MKSHIIYNAFSYTMLNAGGSCATAGIFTFIIKQTLSLHQTIQCPDIKSITKRLLPFYFDL